MATATRQKKTLTVGALRNFLEGVPDSVRVVDWEGEKCCATLWARDEGESGPKVFFSLDRVDE